MAGAKDLAAIADSLNRCSRFAGPRSGLLILIFTQNPQPSSWRSYAASTSSPKQARRVCSERPPTAETSRTPISAGGDRFEQILLARLGDDRSEEHTSELQSPDHPLC